MPGFDWRRILRRSRPATRGAVRDIVIVFALFGALIVSGIISYLNQAPNGVGTAYSSYSASGNGLLALYEWLPALGYHVQRLEDAPFGVPSSWGALVIIAPSVPYTPSEAGRLAVWVRAGGTAILALNGDSKVLLTAFNTSLGRGIPAGSGSTLTPDQPLVESPPVRRVIAPTAVSVACDNAAGCITYLRDRGAPVLVGRTFGQGRIFLLGAPDVLANSTIRTADNRLLPVNLLAALPPGATVGFDEFHHGIQVQQVQSVNDLLYTTPVGRALLYAGLLVLVYLIWGSRRLGRPIQENQAAARSISEYIVSMGALYRRSGNRADALAVVTDAFRQDIAETYHIEVNADDTHGTALVEALRERGVADQRQAAELMSLLAPDGKDLDEAELVRRVRALDTLRDELGKAHHSV